MRLVLLCSAALSLACARPVRTAGAFSARPAECGGYDETYFTKPGRPLTPCEVDKPARFVRDLPSQFPLSYVGPCQYVEVQLVVDTLGRPEEGSVVALRTSSPHLAENVVREVVNARLLPGRLAGVPVRQVHSFYYGSPRGSTPCERG
jgi:hypothetical protein